MAKPDSNYKRVRRPRDKEPVIEALRNPKHGAFSEIRDVLVFAAALGYARDRRVPFEKTGEQIRWETAIHRRGTETLVALLAVATSDDKEVLEDSRFPEQIRAFEEFANGGLEILAGILNKSARSARDEVLELVQRELRPPTGDDALIRLAESAQW